MTQGPNAALSIGYKVAVGGLLHQAPQAVDVALAREHLRDRGGGVLAQRLFGGDDVENAAIACARRDHSRCSRRSVQKVKPVAMATALRCRWRGRAALSPAASAAPASAVVLRNVLRSCSMVSSST